MTDLTEVLAQLKDKRNNLNVAINALSKVVESGGAGTKRRGRPPGSSNKPKPAQIMNIAHGAGNEV